MIYITEHLEQLKLIYSGAKVFIFNLKIFSLLCKHIYHYAKFSKCMQIKRRKLKQIHNPLLHKLTIQSS